MGAVPSTVHSVEKPLPNLLRGQSDLPGGGAARSYQRTCMIQASRFGKLHEQLRCRSLFVLGKNLASSDCPHSSKRRVELRLQSITASKNGCYCFLGWSEC